MQTPPTRRLPPPGAPPPPLPPPPPRHDGLYVNVDDWSSYMWERDLLLGHLADRRIPDVAVLTGDVHSFWQSTLQADYDDPRSPAVLNEFVGGSVSSPFVNIVGSDDLGRGLEDLAGTWSPRFRYCDFRRNGYGIVRVTPDAMQVAYRATRVRLADAGVVAVGAGVLAVRPGSELALVAPLGVMAVGHELTRPPRHGGGRRLLGGALLAVGAVIQARSRTGQPWCQPEGPFHGHGLWHLLSAAGLYLVADAALAESAAGG